ncbi:hypothetical protein [Selenomonas sp. TAMA-11512]
MSSDGDERYLSSGAAQDERFMKTLHGHGDALETMVILRDWNDA